MNVLDRRGEGFSASEDLCAGELEARVGCFYWNFELGGDIGHRALFEVVHDEEGAELGAEAPDELAGEAARSSCHDG